MEERGPQGPNEVQASHNENGAAVAIIVLAVLSIDSALGRTRYVREENAREHAVKTLQRLNAGGLADDIEELFVLRDAIAHNHLWEGSILSDPEKGLRYSSVQKLPGYGDEKSARTVDEETRQTHRLHLDVVPRRMHRQTAVVVLRKCVEVLRFLQRKDLNYLGSNDPHIACRFQGTDGFISFYEWVDRLQERG